LPQVSRPKASPGAQPQILIKILDGKAQPCLTSGGEAAARGSNVFCAYLTSGGEATALRTNALCTYLTSGGEAASATSNVSLLFIL
jgi:hypothetical protein